MAQEEEKKKKKFKIGMPKIKKPNLRIGEKIGKLAGNMMTGKTDNLSETAPIATLTSGIYDPRTKTSEVKYLPKGTVEGDHIVAITFMKQEGIGMLEINGEVTCNGLPMENAGLGSYTYRFEEPLSGPTILNIKTSSGQEAQFTLNPIAEIEIISFESTPKTHKTKKVSFGDIFIFIN